MNIHVQIADMKQCINSTCSNFSLHMLFGLLKKNSDVQAIAVISEQTHVHGKDVGSLEAYQFSTHPA